MTNIILQSLLICQSRCKIPQSCELKLCVIVNMSYDFGLFVPSVVPSSELNKAKLFTSVSAVLLLFLLLCIYIEGEKTFFPTFYGLIKAPLCQNRKMTHLVNWIFLI